MGVKLDNERVRGASSQIGGENEEDHGMEVGDACVGAGVSITSAGYSFQAHGGGHQQDMPKKGVK